MLSKYHNFQNADYKGTENVLLKRQHIPTLLEMYLHATVEHQPLASVYAKDRRVTKTESISHLKRESIFLRS